MSRFKKTVAVLCGLMALLPLGACGDRKPNESEEIDPNRTQINVSNFNGGYGDEWLKAVKKRFEAENANVSYEEGKTGVQIIISNEMIGGKDLLNSISSSPNHVFFNETINYYDAAASGKILDITEMMKEKLPGEEESIFDKLDDNQQKFMDINGKYYMLPHYEAFYGITIDVDLFDAKRLFFGSDGTINYKSTEKDKLSKGPDNKTGTYDDGLPATYAQFFELFEMMKRRGVTPISWAGDCQFYATRLVDAMAADCNGAANTLTGIRFQGSLNNVVDSVSSNGTVTLKNGNGTSEISAQNGWETMKQQGYYYALQFMEDIVSDENNFYAKTFTGGQSNTDAQMDYLLSSKDIAFEKPIAMLLDGCWWEGEASGTFEAMTNGGYLNSAKNERRFRFIPFPKATDKQLGQGQTLLEINNAFGFIRTGLSELQQELAVKFLQYCYTDESLREFTRITSATKGVDYEMTTDDLEACTYYGKSIVELKKAEGTQVVYQLSDSTLYKENLDSFALGYRFQYNVYTNPSTVFNTDQQTAISYFNGFSNYWKDNWEKLFGKYWK